MPDFYIETAIESNVMRGADLHILDAMTEAQRLHGGIAWSKMSPTVVRGTILSSGDRVVVADMGQNSDHDLNVLTAWVDAED